MKYDLSYYVLTSGCNNASFLQLHKLITFLLTKVSGKVSVVGDIWSVEVSDTSLVKFSNTKI